MLFTQYSHSKKSRNAFYSNIYVLSYFTKYSAVSFLLTQRTNSPKGE